LAVSQPGFSGGQFHGLGGPRGPFMEQEGRTDPILDFPALLLIPRACQFQPEVISCRFPDDIRGPRPVAHLSVTVEVRQVIEELRAGRRGENKFLQVIPELPSVGTVEKSGRRDDEWPGLCQKPLKGRTGDGRIGPSDLDSIQK
jgi:hypothetical protein